MQRLYPKTSTLFHRHKMLVIKKEKLVKITKLRFEKLLEFANIKFENHKVCNTVHQPFIQSELKRFKHLVDICNFKVNFAVKVLLLIG